MKQAVNAAQIGSWLSRWFAALVCCALLTSCFVPDQYEAEIRLSSDGSYGITAGSGRTVKSGRER